ncbi:MAG: hypothetical protein JWO10_2297 [Microbacteriaceae bacterium]|nr:hypothetical protein [Microbacteriaceae bacterium]
MADDPTQTTLQSQLPESERVGVFADFVAVWHTPTTFVLDFQTVTAPVHPSVTPGGEVDLSAPSVLEAVVNARVRIPSEQIFPLIAALQEQGDRWLAETGRAEPPTNWIDPSR